MCRFELCGEELGAMGRTCERERGEDQAEATAHLGSPLGPAIPARRRWGGPGAETDLSPGPWVDETPSFVLQDGPMRSRGQLPSPPPGAVTLHVRSALSSSSDST